ncbi:MAG: hypothetical protein IPQ04_09370 [Saprospiraceae bacterium]|nr:hypothetical protein [Saprospiraceae bacterium]
MTLVGQQGQSPYRYFLTGREEATGVFNNLGSGTYSVTVQDAQLCSVTGQVVVGVLNGPDVNITNLTQTSCGRNNGSFK